MSKNVSTELNVKYARKQLAEIESKVLKVNEGMLNGTKNLMLMLLPESWTFPIKKKQTGKFNKHKDKHHTQLRKRMDTIFQDPLQAK